jgi:signal transduction histidine kinase
MSEEKRGNASAKTERFFADCFDPSLDMRVQAFHLLALAGMASGAIAALSALFTNAGTLNVVLNVTGFFIGLGCLVFARRTNKYRAGFLLAVVLTFLVLFPLLFFSAGAYLGGMPSFFIFAFVFTAMMLEGKAGVFFVALEFALYAACFAISRMYPDTVAWFPSERDAMLDALIGVFVVGLMLTAVTLLHARIYDNRQKRLGSLDRLKTEFLQNISHELKTPLTVMINCALDTLRELERTPPDVPEMTFDQNRIRAEGERLKRMVSQLLDVTAIESGKLKIHKERISLADALSRTAAAHCDALRENETRLVLEIPENPPDVAADADAVERVLLNLLSNAARHAKGGVITLSLSAENDRQTVRVSDDGEGMTPEVRSQVFLRYVERESRATGRSGMGLFICKKLIDAHGGEIGVESEPGRGTAVWFRLPAGEAEAGRT